MATQAPVKVDEMTREKIRYAAALSAMTQARLVEAAVDEYLVRHAAELAQGIARARAALRLGDDTAVADLIGADPETAQRAGARLKR